MSNLTGFGTLGASKLSKVVTDNIVIIITMYLKLYLTTITEKKQERFTNEFR